MSDLVAATQAPLLRTTPRRLVVGRFNGETDPIRLERMVNEMVC
jgi:hypothetical protein